MACESTDSATRRDIFSEYPDDFVSLATTIARHGDELRQLPNVIRIGVGFKLIGGVETHRRCITVFVARKVHHSDLGDDELVPPRFRLHLTDVVVATG